MMAPAFLPQAHILAVFNTIVYNVGQEVFLRPEIGLFVDRQREQTTMSKGGTIRGNEVIGYPYIFFIIILFQIC